MEDRLNKLEYKNQYCKECIRKNIAKYGKFDIKCDGINVDKDVKFALSKGIDEEDAKWMFDTRFFFERVYGSPPRVYQEPILLCSSRNLVSRQCRQTGKTLSIVFKIMHFLLTNDNKTALIITPNEAQVKKIYEEYILRDCVYKNAEIKESVVSKTQKPYYKVEFCNGSKVVLMVAGDTVRGQSADWIYIDEAAIIGTELLNSILMTIASRGDDAVIIQTSTPKGRGNQFYKACKEYSEYNEYHISIYQVDEMKNQIGTFKRQLGETGFKQEAEAEFPDISGGPFNYRGIDLAKSEYEYESCTRKDGIIYIGGVDWNGPSIGTYFYIIAFDPNNYTITIVDKMVVSSSEWNSLVAKQTLINLNRKWGCKHWMADYGYSSSIIEELRAYSMKCESSLGRLHPDAQIKHILETVEFGAFLTIKDPFTKEEQKKTTKSFIVSQMSRLFEPNNDDMVAIKYSINDEEMTKSLENYKLLNVTSKGFEQYGFEKGDGIEDHALDALGLAVYGVVKYYGELFKRIILQAVTIGTNSKIISSASLRNNETINAKGANVLLISDNDKSPIEQDEKLFSEDIRRDLIVSRTFDKSTTRAKDSTTRIVSIRNRSGIVRRRLG